MLYFTIKIKRVILTMLWFLVGPFKTIKDEQVPKDLVKMFPDLLAGGHWRPLNCTARDKVAILIPYRNRETHLYILLRNLHPFLQHQLIDYTIFVIEQAGKWHFFTGKTHVFSHYCLICVQIITISLLIDNGSKGEMHMSSSSTSLAKFFNCSSHTHILFSKCSMS